MAQTPGATGHWLQETRGPFFELTRHFLRRFFDSDLITTQGQLLTLVIGVFAGLGSLGFFLAIRLFRKYIDLSTLDTPQMFRQCALADKLFFICFAMILVGFLASLQWHSLFPDLQDYLILGTLPVSARQVFSAKFLALVVFVAIFVLDLNLPSSLAIPGVFAYGHGVGVKWGVYAPGGMTVFWAHLISTCAASTLVFFTLLACQGVMMNLIPPRFFQRFALYTQIGLLLALLCCVPVLFLIPDLYASMDQRPSFLFYVPPLWFLGLYERLLGSADPYAVRLAQLAMQSLLFSSLATAALYALSYRRHAARLIESPQAPQGQNATERAAAAFLDRVIPSSQERALLSFIWKTLSRSRQHKVFLAAYAGSGCALVLDGVLTLALSPRFHGFTSRNPAVLQVIFSIPLVLSFFLLSGMRYIFAIPSELRANWIFRITEDEKRPLLLDAVEKSLLLLGVLPVLFVTSPVLLVLLGWQLAGFHLAFTILLSLLLIELLLVNFQKLPFTCSYLPGKQNPTQVALIYWFAFSTYAYTVTGLEAWSLQSPTRLGILLGAVLFAVFLLRRVRKEFWGQLALVFDDLPEPAVHTLGLQRE